MMTTIYKARIIKPKIKKMTKTLNGQHQKLQKKKKIGGHHKKGRRLKRTITIKSL